jgi:hypothetical protein
MKIFKSIFDTLCAWGEALYEVRKFQSQHWY